MLMIINIMSETYNFDSDLVPFFTKNDVLSVLQDILLVDLISIIFDYYNGVYYGVTVIFNNYTKKIIISSSHVPIFKELSSYRKHVICFFNTVIEEWKLHDLKILSTNNCDCCVRIQQFPNVVCFKLDKNLSLIPPRTSEEYFLNPYRFLSNQNMTYTQTHDVYIHDKSREKFICFLRVIISLYNTHFPKFI